MGGYGSGRRGERPVVEQTPAIRVRDLRLVIRAVVGSGRDGALRLVFRQGLLSVLAIHCSIVPVASQRLSLIIALVPPEQPARETVVLAATPQPFGQRLYLRWWFACPGCGRSCGALFLHQGRWRCRRCARLIYRSSTASDKRVGPHLRGIERSWRNDAPDHLATLAADPGPQPEDTALATARAALKMGQDLRLQFKASRLALRRLERGVPLHRERASR